MVRGILVASATILWSAMAFSYNAGHLDKCKNQKKCSNKNLSGAVFNGGEYGNVSFKGSNLQNAVFDSVGLGGADFSNSATKKTNLSGAVFKNNSYLDGAAFNGVTNMKNMKILNCWGEHINFYNANLDNVTLKNTRFNQGDFRKSTINNAVLQGVNLSQTRMNNVQIHGSKLINVYASSVNFTNASIKNAAKDGIGDSVFEGVRFPNTIFKNALIRHINFENGKNDCNLNHPNLSGSDWKGSNVLRCSDKGADWNSTLVKPKNY